MGCGSLEICSTLFTIGTCVSILKVTSRAAHLLILSIKRNAPMFRRTAELEDSGMDYIGFNLDGTRSAISDFTLTLVKLQ